MKYSHFAEIVHPNQRCRQQSWGNRVVQATAAWSVLGVLTGVILATAAGCEVIDYVAYITAGLIVLLPAGIVAGLLIGRGFESLAGGMTGLLVAAIAAPSESAGFFLLQIWSLMMGAVIGTTGWPIARVVARILGAIVNLICRVSRPG